MKLLFFIPKKLLFLTVAEKQQITETAIFGGCGGKTAVGGGNYDYHNKRIHVKFGCSRSVLKFSGWQLKNGKITVRK